MEALRNSLKIGVGLVALVGLSLTVLPERPTLFGGSAQAEEELILAAPPTGRPAGDVGQDVSKPVVLAQASQAPASPAGAATGGQSHLERLRQRAREAGQASSPGPTPSRPPAPAAAPEPAPAAQPAETPAAESSGRGLDTLTQPAQRPRFQIYRSAQSINSATIEADGEAIRLAGLVPVEADAVCADGDRCGASAQAALDEWLAGQEVLCAITPGADAAPCVRGEKDIGEWAVENGWALAAPGSAYEPIEARARDEGVGIWASGGL